MNTALWVALIAVTGVIVQAVTAFLTGRRTSKETAEREGRVERREQAVREENDRQRMREVEERGSSRDHEDELRKAQAHEELQGIWRDRRLIAHRTALAAVHAAFEGVEQYRTIVLKHAHHEDPSLLDSSLLTAALATVPEVELLGSESAGAALRKFTSKLASYHWTTKLSIASGNPPEAPYSPAGEPQEARWDDIIALGDALMAYQHEARKDLGTLN